VLTPDPITRTLIAGHVVGAFAQTGSVSKADLIRRAQETDGPDGVLVTLLSLPDRSYRDLNELWTTLPDLPIE
jgi:hypothetical protein